MIVGIEFTSYTVCIGMPGSALLLDNTGHAMGICKQIPCMRQTMSYILTDADKAATQTLRDDERFNHFVNKVSEHEELWILTDEHGCMMLTSDDEEDCIPVWPHADYAKEWAVDDWSQCKPEAITLKVWQARWVPGMEDDELLVAVFPTPDASGVVVEPRELQDAFARKQKLARHN